MNKPLAGSLMCALSCFAAYEAVRPAQKANIYTADHRTSLAANQTWDWVNRLPDLPLPCSWLGFLTPLSMVLGVMPTNDDGSQESSWLSSSSGLGKAIQSMGVKNEAGLAAFLSWEKADMGGDCVVNRLAEIGYTVNRSNRAQLRRYGAFCGNAHPDLHEPLKEFCNSNSKCQAQAITAGATTDHFCMDFGKWLHREFVDDHNGWCFSEQMAAGNFREGLATNTQPLNSCREQKRSRMLGSATISTICDVPNSCDYEGFMTPVQTRAGIYSSFQFSLQALPVPWADYVQVLNYWQTRADVILPELMQCIDMFCFVMKECSDISRDFRCLHWDVSLM